MGQRNSQNLKDHIIIGIYFGTSKIKFSYGFLDDPHKTVYHGSFEYQRKEFEVSPEIILDNTLREVLCFGNECSSYICKIQDIKYHHFKNIKINLYRKAYKIKANNTNKEVDIFDIITKILQKIKDITINQIKRHIVNLDEDNIHWTIAVPAVWEIKAKQIMINAAAMAGLIREGEDLSNFFTLEPEAISIYYHYSLLGLKIEPIDSGKSFILCYLGNNSLDISFQKKVIYHNKIKLEELYRNESWELGFNRIDEQFINKVIKELFGKECFDKTKENICKNNYIILWKSHTI